jgi:hypothetical protein
MQTSETPTYILELYKGRMKRKIKTFQFSQSNAENSIAKNNKDIILRMKRKIICDPNTRKSNEWGTNNA